MFSGTFLYTGDIYNADKQYVCVLNDSSTVRNILGKITRLFFLTKINKILYEDYLQDQN